MSLFDRYINVLDTFDAILPPKLKGIIIKKYDHYNGCIEVEPFGFKAVVEEGVIYNYPNNVTQQRRQVKCPGVNDTLVNKFSADDGDWVDDCAPMFNIQKKNCIGEDIYITLEEAFGDNYHLMGCHNYYSYVLQKDILRVNGTEMEPLKFPSFEDKGSPNIQKPALNSMNIVNMENGSGYMGRANQQDILHVFQIQ